jgi:hypothetical protein
MRLLVVGIHDGRFTTSSRMELRSLSSTDVGGRRLPRSNARGRSIRLLAKH